MNSFTIENRTVTVFPAAGPDRPVIYLNTFGQEGEQVLQNLQTLECPDLTLVAVSDLEWNHDMSPWAVSPLSEKDTPFTGGADDYLRLLTGKIIPEAERSVNGTPAWRGIAGYSLAGLFAIYAICRTNLFSRAASISGSLWFPDIKEYLFTHELNGKTDHLYFSLGDREHHTRNKVLKRVRQNTEEIFEYYKSRGIDTVFRLNPGNHFKNAVERSGDGIAWLLSR